MSFSQTHISPLQCRLFVLIVRTGVVVLHRAALVVNVIPCLVEVLLKLLKVLHADLKSMKDTENSSPSLSLHQIQQKAFLFLSFSTYLWQKSCSVPSGRAVRSISDLTLLIPGYIGIRQLNLSVQTNTADLLLQVWFSAASRGQHRSTLEQTAILHDLFLL